MKPQERINIIEEIAIYLQENFVTSQINAIFKGYSITDNLSESVNSKKVYARKILGSQTNELILNHHLLKVGGLTERSN